MPYISDYRAAILLKQCKICKLRTMYAPGICTYAKQSDLPLVKALEVTLTAPQPHEAAN